MRTGGLHLPALRLVVAQMVAAGTADYDPPKKSSKAVPTSALIYWRRPEEWATIIYDWVRAGPLVEGGKLMRGLQIKETGQNNTIMTFYELTEGGDLAATTGEAAAPFDPGRR